MPDTPETVLDVRMSLEALLAGEATIDETVSDLVGLARTPSSAAPEVSELVGKLWYLHRRGLSYASDAPAVNLLLADLSEGIGKAATALETLEARVKVLEEALEPFAKAADIRLCGEWADHKHFGQTDVGFHLTFGDLRQARAALLKQLSGDENG